MENFCFRNMFSLKLKYTRTDSLLLYRILVKRCVISFIQIGLIMTLIQILFPLSVFSQTKPSIAILQVESDDFIKGKVEGLKPEDYAKYKVIVYVKTNKWYIHPYDRGGPGKSYADIKQDGTWTIGTIKREFPADHVAALLVRGDYKPPSTVESLGTLQYIARDTKEGGGKL